VGSGGEKNVEGLIITLVKNGAADACVNSHFPIGAS
jgi:hypothetical protein